MEAIDGHGSAADVQASRARARRLAALAEFTAEYGESGLRELGGRRDAERRLEGRDDPSPDLLAFLQQQAGV